MSGWNGWIKISRSITEHWLWKDSERLQWWLDLLFMASWEDKQVLHDAHLFVLHRGQMIASVSFLAKRWNRSNPTIIAYLQMLESDGMITREVLYRQTPIITICKYDAYQYMVDTIVDRQVDTIVDTNKEYKEGKEYKESKIVVNSSLCAREEKFFDTMRNTQTESARLVMSRHAWTLADYLAAVDDFEQQCRAENYTHRDEQNAVKHFRNWTDRRFKAGDHPGSSAAPVPQTLDDIAFDEAYRQVTGTKFVWSAETSRQVDELARNIETKFADNSGRKQTEEERGKNMRVFVIQAYQKGNDWIRGNFTPRMLAAKFNELYSMMKNGNGSNAMRRDGETLQEAADRVKREVEEKLINKLNQNQEDGTETA